MPVLTGPASEKQRSYITSLLEQREVPEPFKGSYTAASAADDLSKQAASDLINALLGLPKPGAAVASVVQLPEGFYALDGDIYKVVTGKASSKRYAKILVLHGSGQKGTWHYAPYGHAKLVKQGATPVTLQYAKEHGLAHGWCMCCGATLTDPVSVAAGIGPVCAKKFS